MAGKRITSFGLRVTGWLGFVAGGILFMLRGGFAGFKDIFCWIGLFVMLAGMLLTSASNLLAHFERQKRIKESLGPPPPPPPQVV